jgi:hypothetical protein
MSFAINSSGPLSEGEGKEGGQMKRNLNVVIVQLPFLLV